jgi:hypothetical protein
MKEGVEILQKPSVGGVDSCGRCGHPEWEHNVDIVVDGKIVRRKSKNRLQDICLHEGSLLCCHANCRNFQRQS